MTGTIWTAPAGAGKTEALIREILQTEEAQFGQELWVLLPTRLQVEAFRERVLRMARQQGRAAVFNLRLFNFYELYNHLLDFAGSPQRTVGRAVTNRILRHVIIQEMEAKALRYYASIATMPGFVSMMSDLINELKQGMVEVPDFEHYAAESGSPKQHDLALIYRRYQEFLQGHHLVDRDGAGWVALTEVQHNPEMHQMLAQVALLAVDGYDQFTPLQARLLRALCQRLPRSLITLTYEAHRQEGACRTFHHTLQRLQQDAAAASPPWVVAAMPPKDWHSRPQPALNHLCENLFELDAPLQPASGALQLIEAPDPHSEARAVMRDIRRHLLAGVAADEILVVMRQSSYAEALRNAAQAYDLPVLVRQEAGVLENPAVNALLKLIDLHAGDFKRRDVMDVLWNPYFIVPDLQPEDIPQLEQLSLERRIVQGREAWQDALAQPAPPLAADDRGEEASPPADENLLARLQRFFERVTPRPQASVRHYMEWIEALIGKDPEFDHDLQESDQAANHFNLIAQVRANPNKAVEARDLHALHSLRQALQEVLAADALLTETTQRRGPVLWEDFRRDLELALRHRRVQQAGEGTRARQVLVTTVLEARGLPHSLVYIVGMAEGIFPQQRSEDPLYSDNERYRMEDAGIDVQTPLERSPDTGLFYEMCALAQQRLTLSRPSFDQGGNPWSPSIYWQRALALLAQPDLTRLALGDSPEVDAAANLREVAVSVSRALSQAAESVPESVLRTASWLAQYPIWEHLLQGRSIELNREDASPFDGYSGRLADPLLRQQVAAMLGEQRLWSATQFNELAQCGFRFFSRRLLHLEPFEEPEEGMDALQLGTLNHAILEESYRRIGEQSLAIVPENQEAALAILQQVAAEILSEAPRRFGFRPDALWPHRQQSLLARLERLLRLDFSPDSPLQKNESSTRRAGWQEADFGMKGQPPAQLHGAAGTLQARGSIDRADFTDDGRVLLLDYKSGKVPQTDDIKAGRNFQMLLYLHAAQQMLERQGIPYQVAGGLFWSVNKAHKGKEGSSERLGLADLAQAEDTLHQRVLAARDGDFASDPAKREEGKCTRYCEFFQFCRVKSVQGPRD